MRSIEPIAKFDLAFSLFCLQHRFNHPVSRISKAISHTGDGHLYLVFGVLAYLFAGKDGQLFFMAGLLAFGIELPIYWFAKNLFKRRRPQEFSDLVTSFITPSDRYSLPSGHTTAAFLMASITGHYFVELEVFTLIWASLIASSRILLGVHFLTDVLLGAFLGIGVAQTALAIIGS